MPLQCVHGVLLWWRQEEEKLSISALRSWSVIFISFTRCYLRSMQCWRFIFGRRAACRLFFSAYKSPTYTIMMSRAKRNDVERRKRSVMSQQQCVRGYYKILKEKHYLCWSLHLKFSSSSFLFLNFEFFHLWHHLNSANERGRPARWRRLEILCNWWHIWKFISWRIIRRSFAIVHSRWGS